MRNLSWSIAIVAGIALMLGVGCNEDDEKHEGRLTADPGRLQQGTSVRVRFESDVDVGSGEIEFSVAPTSGLTFNAPVLESENGFSVVFHVSDTAALGVRQIKATSGKLDGIGTIDVVKRLDGAMALAFEPAFVQQGASARVEVRGEGTRFDPQQSTVEVPEGSGLFVSDWTVIDDTRGLFNVDVEQAAPLGGQTVRIVSHGESAEGVLIVDVGASGVFAKIAEIMPSTLQAGTSREVIVYGENTHFSVESVVEVESGVAIVPSELVVTSASELRFVATVAGSQEAGDFELRIKSPKGQGFETVTKNITVTPAATMEFHLGNHADQGAGELIVQLVGVGTHFSGETVLEIDGVSTGVDLEFYRVANPSLIDEVTVNIPEDATAGPVVFIASSPLATGGEERVSATFFVDEVIVNPGVKVNPSSGIAGSQVELLLDGVDTHFVEGTTTLAVTGGTGLTIDSFEVLSETQIQALVSLDREAESNSIHLTVVTGAESVATNFQLLDYSHGCSDFVIDAGMLSQGSFGKMLGLDLQDGQWPNEAFSIGIDESPEHIYLDESDCSAPAASHISCFATVGLFAIPGKHLVRLNFPDASYCGVLQVAGQQLSEIAVPAGVLPDHSADAGHLDYSAGAANAYYRFEPRAGDTLVFHGFSDDRENLDPTLALIDASGDQRLLFVDDETLTGLDSRIVYHFATGEAHYLQMGVHSSSDFGDYRFYLHRLTHGNTVSETDDANDSVATAQTVADTPPYVLYGAIDDSSDIDVFQITTQWPAAVDVVARRLGAWDGVHADLTMAIYDATGSILLAQNSTWHEEPTASRDPRAFLEQPGTYYVVLSAENNKTGFYGLNVRPAIVVNEIDNRDLSSDPFVELLGPPTTYSSFWSTYWPMCDLCTYDSDGNPLDGSAPCVTLADFLPSVDGYAVVRDSLLNNSALAWPDANGALELRCNSEVLDRVQFGTGSHGIVEGTAAERGEKRPIGRGAGVDTNQNAIDFIYMASPTPGRPNDRTHKSVVPLFGEPLG